MNDWYGNLTLGQSVKMTFNSYLLATGASTTVTDLVPSDVLVSKDGVAQTTQGAGVTVEIDKNATGAHFITIDTSNTTDAGFYVAGADYQVEFIGATIDTATVNSVVGTVSIEHRSDKVDLVSILGTALTETPGQLAAAFKKLFDVAVPTLVASDVMRGTDGANTTVPDAAGVVPTAIENRQEMDNNSTQFGTIISDIDTVETIVQLIVQDTAEIQGKLPLQKMMGSSDGASEDGTLEAILADVTGLNGDVMRGTDGANTTVPDAAGVAPTAVENREEIDINSTQLALIISTGSTGPWTTGGGGGGGDATEANQITILAKLLSYVRILGRKDTAIATDDAAQVTEINADEGAGAGAYNNTTDSQEAIKDSVSGGGGTPDIR